MDLFAGSGAYGLEALSRGSEGGIFVENNSKALTCLRANVAAVCKSLGRDEAGIEVLPVDAVAAAGNVQPAPDLVFIDPPYEIIQKVAGLLFEGLRRTLEGKPDALVVFELPGEVELAPEGWSCVKRLGRGPRQPTAAFFQRA